MSCKFEIFLRLFKLMKLPVTLWVSLLFSALFWNSICKSAKRKKRNQSALNLCEQESACHYASSRYFIIVRTKEQIFLDCCLLGASRVKTLFIWWKIRKCYRLFSFIFFLSENKRNESFLVSFLHFWMKPDYES